MSQWDYRSMIERLTTDINYLKGIIGYMEAALNNPKVVGERRQEYGARYHELNAQIRVKEKNLRKVLRASWGLESLEEGFDIHEC